MSNDANRTRLPDPVHTRESWRKPGFDLIPLDCEITAYAPDADAPLV
jgi:hypothetical protein